MARSDLVISKMAAVLIPVVVGSLLSLIVSVATNYYTFRVEQNETVRKERMAHLERAMTLTARYSNDVGKLLGIGFITKGDITSNDLAIMSAPTDTLMELNVVISLYFPQLKSDLDQIFVGHGAMMQRFDNIVDTQDEHRREDAASFNQRIQKEMSVTMDSVRSLMKKLSELAT
ncbi:hypothetical protein [Methylomonas albis]|uniref:Uncharacterized protein n=1 Tax=Methylomonas albis TaxID=1854563 RepID=A0ABR9CUE5_9GAMM|nr:hypothetical protein [Methylomonas albis]MBD9354425.1 hypothetical protein [Methylomonas albis]